MRTSVEIDDQLLREAMEITGIGDIAELIKESLNELVQRETAKRLAAVGGSAPKMQDIPRRRLS